MAKKVKKLKKQMNIEFNVTEKMWRTWNKDTEQYDETKLSKKNINKIFNLIANMMVRFGVDENGYVDISRKLLQREVWNYEVYMKYLRMNGYIEHNHYIKGVKSRGYRFSERVKEQLEILKIENDPSDAYVDLVKPENNETSEINLTIPEYVLERIENDFNSCELNYNLEHNKIEKQYDEWGNYIDMGKWFYNHIRLKRWEDGLTYHTWKSNRLYTNFNQLSSKVRETNIRLSNEQLVEFDISSSFALMLLTYTLKTTPEVINDFDFREFSRSVIKGTFYGQLQYGLNSVRNTNKSGEFSDNGLKVEGDKSTRFLSKAEAKLLFQQFLNGNNNKVGYINHVSSDISSYMKLKYPSIYNVVVDTKNTGGKMYDKLVVLETSLIFKIVKELYDTYDDIKILTCQDAIYVPKSFEERVSKVWTMYMDKITEKFPKEKEYKHIDFTGIFN